MCADLSANASALPSISKHQIRRSWERLGRLWSQSTTVQFSFRSWDLYDEVAIYHEQELGKRI